MYECSKCGKTVNPRTEQIVGWTSIDVNRYNPPRHVHVWTCSHECSKELLEELAEKFGTPLGQEPDAYKEGEPPPESIEIETDPPPAPANR